MGASLTHTISENNPNNKNGMSQVYRAAENLPLPDLLTMDAARTTCWIN